MVDSLQIGAAVIVVFVLALTTEILFACCRVYNWLRRQVPANEHTAYWHCMAGPEISEDQGVRRPIRRGI